MDTAPTQTIPEINGMNYHRVLKEMHKAIKPHWYLEVGTHRGGSLRMADCNFVAVDPSFSFDDPIRKPNAREMYLFQKTSDDFFAMGFCDRNDITFQMAFLDGLHLYEALLRDFLNAEKLMSKDGTIFLHYCCPSTVEMTTRKECKGLWTGDVWKTLVILQEYRPDLDIQVLNAKPTGLVMVRGLDPENTVLEENYDKIVTEYDRKEFSDFPGGLAGYFQRFQLTQPKDAIARAAG